MKRKLFGEPRDSYDGLFSGLSEEELLEHGTSSGKFLDTFSEKEVKQLLEESQVFQTVRRKRGHSDLRLTLDLSDEFVHKLYLYSPKTEEPLCELFLRVAQSTDNLKGLDDNSQSTVSSGASFVKSWAKTHGPLRMLVIEWMLLQDPFKSSQAIKLLPGQKMIGLGCAQELVDFIGKLAEKLGVDGLMNKPLYFHNAFLYSPAYTFINPEIEAAFRALVDDLQDDIRERGLGAVSHAINYGALRHVPSGAVVSWTQEEQVRPLGSKLEELFNSATFRALLQNRVVGGALPADDSHARDLNAPTLMDKTTEVAREVAQLQQESDIASERESRGSGTASDVPSAEGTLHGAEGLAYEGVAYQEERALHHAAAPCEASTSLFKAVIDDFRRRKAGPRIRNPIFQIDWDLRVENRAAVEERLKGALPFKDALSV